MPPLRRSTSGPLHLLVDSSDLKLGGAGEWLIEKHGTSRRRSWRKLYIGVDADSGEIVAVAATRKEIDDAAMVDALGLLVTCVQKVPLRKASIINVLSRRVGNRGKNVGAPAFFACPGSTRCDSLRMCRRHPTSPT